MWRSETKKRRITQELAALELPIKQFSAATAILRGRLPETNELFGRKLADNVAGYILEQDFRAQARTHSLDGQAVGERACVAAKVQDCRLNLGVGNLFLLAGRRARAR